MQVFCGRKMADGTVQVFKNGKLLDFRKAASRYMIAPNEVNWGKLDMPCYALAWALIYESFGTIGMASFGFAKLATEVLSKIPNQWVMTKQDIAKIVFPDLVNGESLDA